MKAHHIDIICENLELEIRQPDLAQHRRSRRLPAGLGGVKLTVNGGEIHCWVSKKTASSVPDAMLGRTENVVGVGRHELPAIGEDVRLREIPEVVSVPTDAEIMVYKQEVAAKQAAHLLNFSEEALLEALKSKQRKNI